MPQGTTVTLTPVASPLSSVSGTHRPRHTAQDVFETLLALLGGNPDSSSHRDIKRATLAAYDEFATLHDWTFLYAVARVQLHAAQTAGTIAVDVTGGAYERLVTLSGGTWPSWAERAVLRVGEVLYDVEKLIDATRLTLAAAACPGADIASGTAYTLSQDTYLLPADFSAGDRPQTEQIWRSLYYVPPRDWFLMRRHDLGGTNTPTVYSFLADPKGTGRIVLGLHPAPDTDQTLDFIYRRRMRPLSVWDQHEGTAAVTNGDTVLTLSDPTFTPSMVGTVVRISGSTASPGGLDAPAPYVLERTVREVLSATTAQMDEAADRTLAGVGYVLSDPIDLDDPTAYNAFIYGARKQLCMTRLRDDFEEATKQWTLQLQLAKDADSRDLGRRSASVGDDLPWRLPLKYGRRGPDVE